MPELIPTMSNAKWRRLLNAAAPLVLPVSYWSFLRDDSEYLRPTPSPDEILNSVAIGDTSAIGPFYFRDVRAVRWPERYETTFGPHEPPRVLFQPIQDLADALKNAGKFDFTVTDGNLTLYAYRDSE